MYIYIHMCIYRERDTYIHSPSLLFVGCGAVCHSCLERDSTIGACVETLSGRLMDFRHFSNTFIQNWSWGGLEACGCIQILIPDACIRIHTNANWCIHRWYVHKYTYRYISSILFPIWKIFIRYAPHPTPPHAFPRGPMSRHGIGWGGLNPLWAYFEYWI